MSQVQASSSAAYALQQWQYLQATKSTDAASQPSSGSDPAATAFDPFAGLGGGQPAQSGVPCPPFNLDSMSALIAAQEQSGTSGASGLSHHQQKVFGELDTDGDGSVTKAELEADFGTDNKSIADLVMSKLDKDGDGAISKSEFAAGTTKGGHHHHMHAGPPPGQGSQDPLASLISSTQGASSQSTSNSDGSSTTTITYADGSKVSMTSPASSANTDSSVNPNSPKTQTQANLLKQLIKLQAQLIAPPAADVTAITV